MRRRALFRIPVFCSRAVAALLLLFAPPATAVRGQAAPLAEPSAIPAEPATTPAQPSDATVRSYADDLVDEARRRRLHEARYWHTLLHYKHTALGRRSLVDDPKFFLSPAGPRDPEVELEATIRAFFDPPTPDTKHPVCRFVARYAWIKGQLNLDPARLPVPECDAFSRLLDEMRPESTTLVYPASHMNSPASMFGHTLLTYETASHNKLLAYAVNYSAITTETFGPLFAVKGIFGFYKGYFSVLPYYAKLQEYSDIDHRDMWEYPLNFTREETIRSIMHAYEMDGIYSDYFFFDENCSYTLLFLLEAGRPSLDLTDHMPPWVIPLDTIRAVEDAGLVAGTAYRPSRTTKIRHMATLVSTPNRRLAVDMARGTAGPDRAAAAAVSNDEKIRTYDLATEYTQYLYSRGHLERDVYNDRFLKLLTTRSTLGTATAEQAELTPPPQPEEGHRSNRVQAGVGRYHRRTFQELRVRPAYHTLTDYGRGYPDGSQIVFLDTALRYYFATDRFKLQQLDFVDIVSIAPRDELFTPISWKVRAGLTQRVMADGDDHLIFQLTPGGGFAYRLGHRGLGYAMMETDLNAGEHLRDHYALGVGGVLGLVGRMTDRWSAALATRGLYHGLGDQYGLVDVTVTQNYAVSQNVSISLDVSRTRTREFYRTDQKVAFNVFF